MKAIKFILALLVSTSLIAQNDISTNEFDLTKNRAFIENKGQFENRNWQDNEIKYAVNENPFYIFFTNEGLTYRFDKIIKNPVYKNGDHNAPKRVNISELVHATWIGANDNVEIKAENRNENYYSYAVRTGNGKETENINGISGFQKITYVNLYENIDVEYIIHPEAGVKYSVILHPGADPSQVKLQYSSSHTDTQGENITYGLNADGEFEISTSLADIIEKKPFTFEKDSKSEINSAFKFENDILSFDLDNYDNSKEVIIDPWVVSPTFTTSTAVWEVETDGAGNIYTIGGETPMELRKYTAAGALVWTYVTPWDTNSVWLGTMATDGAGTTYVTSGTSPEIERVNNAGGMVWHQNGGGFSTEYWSITFNCDKTKLIVGGTGATGIFGPFEARIYDMDVTNGNVLNTQVVGQQGGGFTPVEVRSISSSKNAKYIYLTHDQVGAINQNIGACPTDAPYFEVDNGHHLGYKCENYLPATQNGGGLKALVANDNFFYTHAGDEIHQRDLNTGALINSAPIPGGSSNTVFGDLVVHNSGLAVDDCGNVYAGADDRIVKFDQNLTFVAEVMTNFSVYDVSVNSNGEVIGVGAIQDNGSANRNGRMQSVALTACAQYALVCCDASICPQDTLCETDAALNLFTTTGGGTFSGTGITNTTAGTFDPGVSGSGVFTITYTQLCGSDEIEVVVSPCTNLEACVETNGDITVTNGTGPFSWDEEVLVQDCGACIIGCNFPAGCAVDVPTWQFFANGTTNTPPSMPIQITDNVGSTLIITDPTLLPSCTTTCDATITAAGPFCEDAAAVNLTAAETGGTWSGTGITDVNAGTFDPGTAGPGVHTVTYTLVCGDSDTEDITVTALDNAAFTYPSASYCLTDVDPTPTITGLAGGTFTIDNGGSINAGSGVIDLDASGTGSYNITYTTNGTCPNTSVFAVTITASADATIAAAGPFCLGDAAVNLTAADAGGVWAGTGITDVNAGTFDPSVAGAGITNITYTIAGGCGDTDNINITVNAGDDSTFTYPSGSYCLTDADPTPTITGLAGGAFAIDNGGSINAGTGVIDISASGAGTYNITYTTNGPCPTIATVQVIITAGADATITAAGPFCEGDAGVNLVAVDGGGVWAGTGITDVNAGTFDPGTAGAGVHNITYTISGGCGDTDNIDITVNASDDSTFAYTAGSYCLTDPNPTPTISGLAGGTFAIDGGATINPTTGEIDITASGAGTYNITYATNGPCPTIATESVVLTTGADATITAAGPFCGGDAAVNLAAVDGGGVWAGTGITDVNAGTFNPATAGAGVHNITYTISGGCGDADNIDITVTAHDDSTFAYTAGSYCLTDPNPIPTISGLAGGTFAIDGGATIDAGTGEIDIIASGAGTYNITYTTNGTCPTVATEQVILTAGADATIAAAGPFCEGDAALNLIAVDGGGVWAGTGITDVNAGTFNPATAGPGLHNITYTISGGCGDTDNIDITVDAVDDASFSYSAALYCLTDPNPSATITGLAGGTFTIDNGGSINATTGEVDITASGAGTFNITYTTNGACPTFTTVQLVLTSGADATITAAGPFCENDPAVNLSAVDAGGTWTGTGITDGTLGTFNPATAGAGTHTITYTIGGGCGATDNIDIVVNAADDASFSYAATTYCTLDVDPLPTVTGTAGGTFTINGGGTVNATTGELDLDLTGEGTFTVTYTTNGPCPATATFDITISSGGGASITPAGPYCEPDVNDFFTASVPGGTWSGAGIVDPATGEFDPGTAGVGTHTITYTTAGNCGTSVTMDVVVNAVPTADIDGPYWINWGENIQMNATGGTTYNWTPDEYLSCSDCPDPVASPVESTEYCVIAIDNGCLDTACVQVLVNLDCGDIYVPNVFTPNSGDENAFECVMGGCLTQVHMRIYDRWGELVFETYDKNECWDGTHMRNGKPMSTAVFVYILTATKVGGEEVEMNGNITLVR
jgi:gliding motility-associated-like protein